MKHKAVGLLSGGLDSILACRMMLEQGMEVLAINFISPFCTCTRNGCRHQASKVAEELGIAIKVMPTGQDYIEMVKHPKHGRGSHMNPCIDCRIFTFSRARAYADEVGAAFVFSGEVLGQRPMSQHLRAMLMIEQESGLEGRLLRPLSARLLEPTLPEQTGIVDREKLLAVEGRSRKVQMETAVSYGINDYPCPAGGCLLTDAQFAARLEEAFAHGEDRPREVELLKIGRHFRLPGGAKVVVGRNEPENDVLRRLMIEGDVILEAADFPGPVTLLRRMKNKGDLTNAAGICGRYCDGKDKLALKIKTGDRIVEATPMPEPDLAKIRVGEQVRLRQLRKADSAKARAVADHER
jgi:tRNA U34 2-thiouridine synthase MnmA/TrmU